MHAFDNTWVFDPRAIFALLDEDECMPLAPAIQDKATGDFWVLEEWMPMIQAAMDERTALQDPPFQHTVGVGEGLSILARVLHYKSQNRAYRTLNSSSPPHKLKGTRPQPCLDFAMPLDSAEASYAFIGTCVHAYVRATRLKHNKLPPTKKGSFQALLAASRSNQDIGFIDRERTTARMRQAREFARGNPSLSLLFVRGSIGWAAPGTRTRPPEHTVNLAGDSLSPAHSWGSSQ